VSQSLEPQTVLARNPAILFNDFDDGIMMMDIDSGLYFDVDAIGGRIWSLLDEPASLGTICAALAEDYDVDPDTCAQETSEFLGELLEKGLIQRA
jgi:Coenzyme PQQ synthesis protein D (PqqD)